MESEYILHKTPYEGVALLSINRSDKRNALSTAVISELRKNIQELKDDSTVRVLVLTGEGAGFSSGMDLKEEKVEGIKDLLLDLYTFPKITIASVKGFALAGGSGLVSACDFVIAEKGAKFGFPEVKRGIVPALVSVLALKQLPDRRLRELLLLGEIIDANCALEYGLISSVVEPEALEQKTLELAKKALESAPEAVKKLKHLLQHSLEENFERASSVTLGDEAKEGISAFFEKRSPQWYQ